VKPGGLFTDGSDPLTRPGHGRASLSARLDVTEDPEDVYRVWVPAHRRVKIGVVPSADVDVEVWDATAATVLLEGRARKNHLVTSSYHDGKRPEEVTLRNPDAKGRFVYLDVYLPENGPYDAEYDASIVTFE
jgi:hypothetical protein